MGMLPELRARAITVSGITSFDVLARVREEISTIHAGADWNDAKKKIVEEIHPFLADPDDPENTEASERRARTILTTNGYQAYSAAERRNMEAQKDVFPYALYQHGWSEHPRESHEALDGLIFPVNSSFYQSHPACWDFNCHCHWTPIMADEAQVIRDKEAKHPPDQKTIIEGHSLDHLDTTGHLVRGPNQIFDVRTPQEKDGPSAYAFNPMDLSISVERIQNRYDHQTWGEFQKWAQKTPIGESTHLTVWDWMNGEKIESVAKPDYADGLLPKPSESAPILQPPPRISPVSRALDLSGLSGSLLQSSLRATAAVDFVHDDGVLPKISVEVNPRFQSTLGEYAFKGGEALGIALKPSLNGMDFTLLEEVGHFLDHQAFGALGGDFASEEAPLFESWRKTVLSSSSVRSLMRYAKNAKPPVKAKLMESCKLREIWARAYAQYIATASGDPVLLKQLKRDQTTGFGPVLYWTPKQFEPILKQLEKIIHSL